jgi:hypothetical protein
MPATPHTTRAAPEHEKPETAALPELPMQVGRPAGGESSGSDPCASDSRGASYSVPRWDPRPTGNSGKGGTVGAGAPTRSPQKGGLAAASHPVAQFTKDKERGRLISFAPRWHLRWVIEPLDLPLNPQLRSSFTDAQIHG